ncbi:MAG: orc1/cdc6 family replication initiation protein [Candidatus Micrarchaeota archaeon]
MSSSFHDILSRATLFKNRDVLSPHYIPDTLPHRDREIEAIMKVLSPALKGQKPRNLFVYGKTGTGKTSCVKYVMEKFSDMKSPSRISYTNCRVYNSRYRIFFKAVKDFIPESAASGYGVSYLYEKLLDWVESDGKSLILVLDEIDMVKDLDDLIYTLTRSNDDLKKGSVSMLGISNKISFKDKLDPRSRSALYETELVFSPYNSRQLQAILAQRVELGFKPGVVERSAINLSAAIAAQETGDARYALKLLLRAGELADEHGEPKVTDKHVENARKSVEEDISVDAISTLPEHQQLVLCAIATLSLEGGKYSKLGDTSENFLLSGEVYEEYERVSRRFKKEARSARWFREYLNELEMLGLITMIESGKGQRGHTRLIRIAYSPEKVRKLIENCLSGEAARAELEPKDAGVPK